jgi:type I restriction enzyme S subunit
MSLIVPLEELFKDQGLLAKAEHWERVPLGKVVQILNGYALKSSGFSSDKGFPVIRIRDLKNNHTRTFYLLEFPQEYLVTDGDLLIGMDGDFICYEWSGGEAIMNQRVCKVTPNENYLLKRLFLYGINGYLSAIQEATSSVTVKHLSSLDILKIPFPIPPLAEQQRIVAKLDALMGKIEANRERLAKIPGILKRFRQAVLAAAVSGKLTEDWRKAHPEAESGKDLINRVNSLRLQNYLRQVEEAQRNRKPVPRKPSNLKVDPKTHKEIDNLPSNWSWVSFEDAAAPERYSMSSGPFGSALGTKDYTNDGVPVIRGQNIRDGRFSSTGFVYISEKKAEELIRSNAEPGDIIIVAVGAGSGQAAIIPESVKKSVLSQNCNKVKVDSNILLNRFLLLYLRNEIALSQFQENTTDTARPFLSLTNIKKLLIPLPPIDEQKEIVKQIESLFAKADKIEAQYNKAKAYLDKLPQALLAKAFRGELVPQDPSDESASVLLERIRAKKDGKTKGKKKMEMQGELF